VGGDRKKFGGCHNVTARRLANMSLLYIAFVLFLNGYAMAISPTTENEMISARMNLGDALLASIKPTQPTAQPPRTLFGVAWSCTLTIFICAWTSVHPNVPPQNRMGGLLARVKLMFWTTVAPELILAWAVRQWFAAREIRDIYNQHRGK